MHSNRSIPSQFRVSQSSVDSVDCTYSCTRRSVSYGENTQMVPRRSISYGKKYSEDLSARYSGTMHHAKDLLWTRGRRGGCCCCSASQDKPNRMYAQQPGYGVIRGGALTSVQSDLRIKHPSKSRSARVVTSLSL